MLAANTYLVCTICQDLVSGIVICGQAPFCHPVVSQVEWRLNCPIHGGIHHLEGVESVWSM